MNTPLWYTIEAKANDSADVMIYDVVGFGATSADSFVRDLKAVKAKTINVRLNTPGGSVFDGLAIYNSLKAHPAKVVVHVDGLAASIGSVIAMAGSEIRMAKSAFMMIHNPSCFAMGDADDMRKQAAMLDKAQGALAQIYATRTGRPVDQIKSAMDDETWYSAQEAKDAGMCDLITDGEEEDDAQATNFAEFDFKMLALEPSRLREFVASRLKDSPANPITAPRGAANPVPHPKEHQTMTLDQFKAFAAENPDAIAPIAAPAVASAVASVRAELTPKPATAGELKAAFPGNTGFVVDQIEAGATLAQAKAAFADVVATENATLKTENARLTNELAEASKGFAGVKNPPQGSGGSGAGDAKARFDSAVKAKVDAGMSRAKAVAAVVTSQPALHREYLDAINSR